MKFTLQPALNYKGTMWSPGYSYEFFGGDTTYCIIPAEVMELGCLLEYKGKAYYEASLAEPMSCSIGAFHAAYHTQMGVYTHEMGIREGGKLAIVAGAGPMGLGALTYALHCDRRPALVCVADINQDRLDRAAELFPPAEGKAETGIDLVFINNGADDDQIAARLRRHGLRRRALLRPGCPRRDALRRHPRPRRLPQLLRRTDRQELQGRDELL